MLCIICNQNNSVYGNITCLNEDCIYLNRIYNHCIICDKFGYMNIFNFDHGYFCNNKCYNRYKKKNRNKS